MTSPADNIQTAINKVEEAIAEYGKRSAALVKAEAAYKYAKARVVTEVEAKKDKYKTAALREAKVTLGLEVEFKDYNAAQIAVDVQRERLRALRDVLSAYQSIGSLTKAVVTNNFVNEGM